MDSAKTRLAILCASALLLLAVVGSSCRSNEIGIPKPVEMRQVTDDLGRTVMLPVKITRAVSLAPNLTENIFAVGAGDRLVGVTTFCNYPAEAKSIQKVGDTISPNLETIVAIKPDVVLVSTASQIEAFKNILEQNGIAVYVTNPDSIEGMLANLQQLGDLFGTRDKADELVSRLQQRISNVQNGVAGSDKPKVFIQIEKEPLFTVGKQSFITVVVEKAGSESVTSNIETPYPKLSKETASTLNPDAIILSVSDDNLEANEVFKNSPAVKKGRIFNVDVDLLSRPGPRLVDALEQIARDLHPDKFGER
jgi:iron complex transport system substrate-binding protein